MKKILVRLLSAFLTAALLIPAAPEAAAYEPGDPYSPDLSELIRDADHRIYVETLTDYYMRTNTSVWKALRKGQCAMFLFEGCSDNLNDRRLADLSFYRVSAVCLVVRLDKSGEPYIVYFNQNCSTIPDRPLEYGAWELEDVGEVGPATVRDGTYELYSVKHMGAYEALHVRDSEGDEKISAVYMTPDGFVATEADCINIHTRTGNHVAGKGMWSAGCMLVGDGDFSQFSELMDSTYYTLYDEFDVGQKVGVVVINRQRMKNKLFALYQNWDAVNKILEKSRPTLPEKYLALCAEQPLTPQGETLRTVRDTKLMTLPCGNETDARSVAVQTLPEGTQLEITSIIHNTRGSEWYAVNFGLETRYVYSGDTEPSTWFSKFVDFWANKWRKDTPSGRADRVLQFVIVKADILVRAVLHPEAAGDGSEQSEAKPFIQMAGVDVVFHNGVELQKTEMKLCSLHETVGHQLFADVLTPASGIHGIAGVCNVAAPADVVGMENVKSHDPAVCDGDAAVALGRKESTPASLIKKLFLRERDALFHDLVPDAHHGGNVAFVIFPDFHRIPPYAEFLCHGLYHKRGEITIFPVGKKMRLQSHLKRGAFFRQEKAAHVGALQFQQLFLFMDSTGISGQTAVCADHPVAGDDDGDFVMSDRAAHRLRGHPGKPLLFGKLPGDFAVGCGLPVRNLQKNFPHRPPERRADGMQRRREIRRFAGEIDIQPALGLRENGGFLFNAFVGQIPGKVFLPLKPQPGQPDLIRGQQNAPQRGIVMLDICHGLCLRFLFCNLTRIIA